MSEVLRKAREYVESERIKIPKEEKPVYHMSVPIGWLNDPNGFSVFRDEYHLFYQFHPYDTKWGNIHWGHVKSRDLICWEELPVALGPDSKYDSFGVFSGSAIEDDGRQLLLYTGCVKEEFADGREEAHSYQCIAIGDGKEYKKWDIPVITGEMLPKEYSREQFRDPKLWKKDDVYYAVLGNQYEGGGQAILFQAKELSTWEFSTVLDQSDHHYGTMWECPDFFAIEGCQILMVSPQNMKEEGLEFHSGNGTVFFLGTYEEEEKKFHRKSVHAVDYGLNFYAPQTLESPDGRRIMIAWMQSWEYSLSEDGYKWLGMMTFPRELTVKGGRVCQNPIKEIKQYYQNCISYEGIQIIGNMKLEGIYGRVLDLTLDIEPGDYEYFEMRFAEGEEHYSSVYYSKEESIVTFSREHSGRTIDWEQTRSMYVRKQNGRLKLRLLLDRYSVEIFANDGEQALSSLIYTPLEENGISFRAKGNVKMNIIKADLVL